jgi:hypothetical protein
MNDRGHKYIDLRVYKGSTGQLPTGTGLPIHIERLPDVIEALRDALRREGAPGSAAPRGALRDEWAAAAESSAGDLAGWAVEGRAPESAVSGQWDIDDGWGQCRRAGGGNDATGGPVRPLSWCGGATGARRA